MPHRGILVVVTLWMGCAGDGPSTTDTDTDTALAACEMAAEEMTCPSCTDGPARCTFGEVEVVRGSCGICQSRSQLLQELCDAGEPATRAELEAGITCEMASCEVFYDACGDPCQPQCVLSWEIPETTCDYACYDTLIDPPGPCALLDEACAFDTGA